MEQPVDSVHCPDCGTQYKVGAQHMGKLLTCSRCGAEFALPQASGTSNGEPQSNLELHAEDFEPTNLDPLASDTPAGKTQQKRSFPAKHILVAYAAGLLTAALFLHLDRTVVTTGFSQEVPLRIIRLHKGAVFQVSNISEASITIKKVIVNNTFIWSPPSGGFPEGTLNSNEAGYLACSELKNSSGIPYQPTPAERVHFLVETNRGEFVYTLPVNED